MTPDSPPPSPESRFALKLLNAFIRWMPIGGGGLLWLHLLRSQDWFLAILMSPVMLVTAVWARYTENFIETFSQSAGDRGKSHARSLSQWLDRQNKELQRRFAKADDQYRRAQANDCRYYKAEGVSEARWNASAMLEEMYVPLALKSGFARGSFAEAMPQAMGAEGAEAAEEKTLRIWDLLRKAEQQPSYRQIAVIAKGGFGKTTLLRQITYRYSVEPQQICQKKQVPMLIPVLLYLREWRHIIAEGDAPDLPTLIAEHHIPRLTKQHSVLNIDWARTLLSRGRALVMIDGFDEVAADQCEPVSRWIDQAVRDYGLTATFILTSRPVGYDRYTGQHPWTPVEVKEFDSEQRSEFLQRWYFCQMQRTFSKNEPDYVEATAARAANHLNEQIERRPELAKLANNPLLLCMIAAYHRFDPSHSLPVERHQLYQKFCQMLLGDRPAFKQINMSLSADKSQAVLQGVALAMVQQDSIAVSTGEMVHLVEQSTRQCAETLGNDSLLASKFIREIEEVSELFVRKEDSSEYEFAHRSFQEYLAAAEVKKRQQDSLLLTLGKEWRDTAVLYAALENPTSLIEQLCERGDREALDLAYDCWLEKRSIVPTETFERLQEKCYAQLEQYMAAGDWKEADMYNYRLMIQVLHKRYDDYFSAEELITFPCADLLRIDRLWTTHSQGRFGFSVQRDIYVECGGVLDGEFSEKPFVRFIQAVGWCKAGAKQYDTWREVIEEDWLRDYDQFIFSSEKGVGGHLPVGVVCGARGVCLFSRIQTCEL